MKSESAFVISPFTNPSGEIVFRLSGWLNGGRVRKNFPTRAEAVVERQVLEIQALGDTAIGGLYTNVSAFGPNVRGFWIAEVSAFRMTFGYEPTAIKVAHGAFATISKANP